MPCRIVYIIEKKLHFSQLYKIVTFEYSRLLLNICRYSLTMKQYRYETFTSIIEAQISQGIYQPGHKLPSVRALMKKFSVSTGTVQQGYEYLMIRGLVESIHKSGYYVSSSPQHQLIISPVKKKPVVRDAVFKHKLSLITSSGRTQNTLTGFNVAAPGDLLIPQKLILRTMQQVIREQGAGLLRYYPSTGSAALKNSICKQAAHYNANLLADELIITDGALQALYIALMSTCLAGDTVAVESPCVFSVLQVINTLRLKVVEIPVDFSTGFDIDYLKKSMRGNKD